MDLTEKSQYERNGGKSGPVRRCWLCFSASDSFESVFEIPEHVLKPLEY